VNSSLFGLEGKVDSLHRAVTLLGLDTVRSAVLEDALGRSVDLKSLDGFGVPTVWSHAAAASVAAKHLSMSARGTSPDVAATAGLLHDIGLLLLLTTEQKGLDSALKSAREANEPLIAHEDACIGFNHQTWGEVLVRAWRLPEGIALAIGAHHCPMREPFDPLAAILWLADYMISRMGFACPRDIVPWVDLDELEELMHKMGLRPPLDRYITEGLVRELVRATQQWSIETSQVPA
jgi:HD-like signal output (HDOD) protein